MKFITVIENSSLNETFRAEHGLCVYIETGRHKLLVDTGASPLTWENAARFGIDIPSIDTVIISHGHYDHANGLPSFVKMNSSAKIYIRENALLPYYHDDRYIGVDPLVKTIGRLCPVIADTQIDDELSLFTNINGRRLWPSSNTLLSLKTPAGLIQDPFTHEQCLVINSEGKKVLISGCAHNGILNILDRYRVIYGGSPDIAISGFHMMKKTAYTEKELRDIKQTARELSQLDTLFYTGHCTGEAFSILEEIMGEKLRKLSSGSVFECP